LFFEANTYDFIFSVDTVWPGSKEIGCPAENPLNILKGFHRMLKKSGRLFLIYWSGQKLLPGYPILENRLNAPVSTSQPFRADMSPELHIMNAKKWLKKAGFNKLRSITYLDNINGPFNEQLKKTLIILYKMLWGHLENELTESDWHFFERLIDPNDPIFILDNPDFHGYFTYTLFEGVKT